MLNYIKISLSHGDITITPSAEKLPPQKFTKLMFSKFLFYVFNITTIVDTHFR